MTTKEIIVRVPVLELVHRDGRVFLFPKSEEEKIMEALENKLFIQVESNGRKVRCSQIVEVQPETASSDYLKLTPVQHMVLRERISYFIKNMMKTPTQKNIDKWVKTLVDGGNITFNF